MKTKFILTESEIKQLAIAHIQQRLGISLLIVDSGFDWEEGSDDRNCYDEPTGFFIETELANDDPVFKLCAGEKIYETQT